MKKWIAIVLVVMVLGMAWVLYSYARGVDAQLPEGIVTEPVSRHDIYAVVTATGSLAPVRTQQLAFSLSGEVVEVLVAEGDVVRAGDVLARLDTTDLELSLRQAEAALAAAEASLERAKRAPLPEEIAAAEAQVCAAQAALDDLLAGPSSVDVRLAELNVDQARNSLYAAQGNRDAVAGSPAATGGAKAQAEAQVLNAEIAVTIAELNRDRLLAGPDASAIAQARAQLKQTESNLARLLNTPSPEDIRVAEAQVAQSRVNVELSRRRLEDALLRAPFDGRVGSWRLKVGDIVNPATPIGTLVDDSSYHVDVGIDETEIAAVRVGQRARIVLDAYPDVEMEAHVSAVDLIGTAAQGIVIYNVRLDLEDADVELKPQMTAAVDIVVAEKTQVVAVPNRALRRDSEGTYVETVVDGQLRRVPVQTGLSSDRYTEILDGIEVGEQVVVVWPRESLLQGGLFGG